MNELDNLTPDQLEAILGTDYQTVIADILRQKNGASGREHEKDDPLGQLPNGHVFFDPAGALKNNLDHRSAAKEAKQAQSKLDEVLGQQTAGRKTYAEALLGRTQPLSPTPMATSDPNAGPTHAPPPAAGPPPSVPPMAPGAPPALANAQTMPPAALGAAGVPLDVQALIAKLRGR